MFSFAILVLVLAPFVAHFAGMSVAEKFQAKAGGIRGWMPSIPNNTVTDPSAEKRWQKRGTLVEARLLKRLKGGAQGVSAEGLAAELGEDVSVVAAVLARMREEIDCRLRVTRGGQLLHDFSAANIDALRKRKRQGLPARASLFVLSVFANIGAAWPIFLSIMVAVGALMGMASSPEPLFVGVGGILAVLGIFGFNVIAGWAIHVLMTPIMAAPRLGSTVAAEEGDMLVDERSRQFLEVDSVGDFTDWMPASRSSRNSGCLVDLDGDGGIEGLLIGLVAAILLAVVVGLTFAAGVWVRGLWRAAKRLGVPDLIMSPTSWIRGSHPVDKLERFIPTNDLVIRVTRALRRISTRAHPEDGGMVQRVMGIASQNDGRVSALEIALAEGLDLNEANTIGAELTTFLDGRIDVSDDGELDFVFRPEVLRARFSKANSDRNAEYISLIGDHITRRTAQDEKSLPVNIPGISYGHLVGTDRLVGGTLLMTACAILLVHLFPGVSTYVQVGVDFLFPLMTLGAFGLSGVARYAAVSMAKLGAFRDMRRAAFYQIDRALTMNLNVVDFDTLAQRLHATFVGAYKKLEIQDVLRELEGVAIDLDLEVDTNAGGRSVFKLDSLRNRKQALEQWRSQQVVFDFSAGVADANEIVFDSQAELALH